MDYLGEYQYRFRCIPTSSSKFNGDLELYYNEFPYKIGDRVAQMIIIPYPQINFVEVEELSSTERGEGGFGSSGN